MIKLEKIEGKEIYKFSIDGKIDEQSVHEFYLLLESKSKEHQQLKIIGVINEIPSFLDFKAFTETVKMKFQALHTISKYALLTDKKWLEHLIPVADFLTHKIDIKVFEINQENEAIVWLENKNSNKKNGDDDNESTNTKTNG